MSIGSKLGGGGVCHVARQVGSAGYHAPPHCVSAERCWSGCHIHGPNHIPALPGTSLLCFLVKSLLHPAAFVARSCSGPLPFVGQRLSSGRLCSRIYKPCKTIQGGARMKLVYGQS